MNLGQIQHLKTDFIEPIPLKADMEYKQFMVIVGTNGSGKTFVNILTWISTMIANHIIISKNSYVKEAIEFYIKNSYDNEVTGTFTTTFTSGAEISVNIEKNIVLNYETNISDLKINELTSIQYLSTNFRLFSAWKPYLVIRDRSDKMTGNDPEKRIDTLLSLYKIFDITTLEGFINKLPMEFTIKHKETLKNITGGTEFDEFTLVHLDNNEIMLNNKKASSFGNGHQAVLNMVLLSS